MSFGMFIPAFKNLAPWSSKYFYSPTKLDFFLVMSALRCHGRYIAGVRYHFIYSLLLVEEALNKCDILCSPTWSC